ncbi:MAG TPA: N-acetylmuramoyl-L-alanine amidase [Rhodanobacteraceae bacterium]|nr:N-acetylmuramoyl-L-alanine amidase [Rhodanobacteraceae bacterium]
MTVLAAFAALAAVCPAQAARVKAVHASDSAGHTRLVIDVSGAVDYKLFALSAPARVVLDLDDSSLGHGLRLPRDSGVLKDVRTGRHGRDGVRVVLDLNAKAHPKSFLLKPDDKDGYRLVVDLYPDAGSTPVAKAVAAHADLFTGARKVVVAIDAGHGGVDPGAHGPHGTLEKNITLKVARDLAKLVDAQPGMTAVLTRTGDYFVPLKRRYQIARQHNADVFVSIHADAFRDSDARGSSVWVLSPRGKTSEAARWLADGQNRADLIGGVSLDDKDDTLAAVLLDLQQGYAMQASATVAENVFKALTKLGPTHKSHIEHANFVVLRSPDVPSILVETAFISNPTEERKLENPAHREKLAEAILGGVKSYFETTPPHGTWFAAQAARRRGETVVAAADTRHATSQRSQALASNVDANVRDMHRVSRGETLSGIARQYGVSLDSLKSANSMDDDTVRTGAVLAIPTT